MDKVYWFVMTVLFNRVYQLHHGFPCLKTFDSVLFPFPKTYCNTMSYSLNGGQRDLFLRFEEARYCVFLVRNRVCIKLRVVSTILMVENVKIKSVL